MPVGQKWFSKHAWVQRHPGRRDRVRDGEQAANGILDFHLAPSHNRWRSRTRQPCCKFSRTIRGLWPRREGATSTREGSATTDRHNSSDGDVPHEVARHLSVGLPQSCRVGAHEPHGAQLSELPLRRLEIWIWRGPEVTYVALSAREVHALLGVGRLLAHVPFRAGFRLCAARCIADNVGLFANSDEIKNNFTLAGPSGSGDAIPPAIRKIRSSF